jgi:hypothetical protein
MAEEIAIVEAVALAVSGPERLRAGEVGTWRVSATSANGQPVTGFAVFAQSGHGSGRPYRAMTNAEGVVEFDFTFSVPAESITLQFTPAPLDYSLGERFLVSDQTVRVTCEIIAANVLETVRSGTHGD